MSSYRICHLLGYGGMGEVYLAVQVGLADFEKLVVIKRMFPHLRHDEELKRLFTDEARLAATIRHPNVVQVLDIRQGDSELFIVMEYLSGQTLRELIKKCTTQEMMMPLGFATRVCADAAAGLHAGHTATKGGKPLEIVHCDVSPANIMVGDDGVTKVLDFGLAKSRQHGSVEDGQSMRGKLFYMPPEMYKGGRQTPRSDVWQLGVVLYEILTGVNPISEVGGADALVRGDAVIASPEALRPNLPRRLVELITSTLKTDPSKRVASADALRNELLGIAREEGLDASADVVQACLEEHLAAEREQRKELQSAVMLRGSDDGKFSYLERILRGAERPATLVRPRRPSRISRVAALAAVMLVIAGIAVFASRAFAPEPTRRSYTVDLDVSPDHAMVRLDGREVGRGGLHTQLVADGATHLLEIEAPGFEPWSFGFKDSSPPPFVRLQELPTGPDAPTGGTLAPPPPTAPTTKASPRTSPKRDPPPPKATPMPARAEDPGKDSPGESLPTTDNLNPWN